MIMHDLPFLIHEMRIMKIGHFSFYLISRHGDFNSGPWPKCCGMGRVSLWAGLLYWGGGGGGGGGSPNSLYKAKVWAYAPGFALWAYLYVVLYPITMVINLCHIIIIKK